MNANVFEKRPRTVRKRRWKPANAISGAVALAIALVVGSLPTPLAAQTGTISGVLTNGETGEPLSNVQISLRGRGSAPSPTTRAASSS